MIEHPAARNPDEQHGAVTELEHARDLVAALGPTGDLVHRGDVLAALRDRLDAITPGGHLAP